MRKFDRLASIVAAGALALPAFTTLPALSGCKNLGSYGDKVHETLDRDDDDSADTGLGDDDTSNPCDDDTAGPDDDTADDDTASDDDTQDDTGGDDDTGEPELIPYGADDCLRHAGCDEDGLNCDVSGTIWLQEGGEQQEDLPHLDQGTGVLALTLREENGYGGLIMATLKNPDGGFALNVEGAQWVSAGGEEVVHFNTGWTFNDGDTYLLTVFAANPDFNLETAGACDSRASNVESLYVYDGEVH